MVVVHIVILLCCFRRLCSHGAPPGASCNLVAQDGEDADASGQDQQARPALHTGPCSFFVALLASPAGNKTNRINVTHDMMQSEDGDIIDCVERQKQHGLDHPLLKTHTIQAQPPPPRPVPFQFQASAATAAGGGANMTTMNPRLRSRRRAWQTWHHGGHCPRGTVAIRRTAAADVLRASSVSRFGCKTVEAARAANAPDVVTGNGHEVST
jgi:hypothetical protein